MQTERLFSICVIDCVDNRKSAFEFVRSDIEVVRFQGLSDFVLQRRHIDPDLILIQTECLDSALAIVDFLHKSSDVPLVVQTENSDELGYLNVLRAGAVKVIPQSVDINIVSAEIEALLDHRDLLSLSPTKLIEYRKGDISLDSTERFVKIGDRPIIQLTQRESQLFALLFHHANTIITLDKICQHVWGYSDGDIKLIRNVVFNLRKKIEDDPRNPHYIINEHGLGYVFKV